MKPSALAVDANASDSAAAATAIRPRNAVRGAPEPLTKILPCLGAPALGRSMSGRGCTPSQECEHYAVRPPTARGLRRPQADVTHARHPAPQRPLRRPD